MWFDNRNVLHVEVYEREPIARIFTTAGNTFYIDSTEKKLPLSDRLSAGFLYLQGLLIKKFIQLKTVLLTDVKNMATLYKE